MGEGEGDEEANVDAGAKVDGWGEVQGKVPSDVLPHPFVEQGEETAPRPMCGTPSP